MKSVLVMQTAFAGDLILALPLAQELRRLYPSARIDVLCIPGTAPLLAGHPAVDAPVVYDKRGGSESLGSIARRLRRGRYEAVISPHRSFRTAVLAFATGAPRRIGFDRAAGAVLYTRRVQYDTNAHEVARNLSLLASIDPAVDFSHGPRLYPGEDDLRAAAAILGRFASGRRLVCVAPGSVWATKRYTPEGFRAVVDALVEEYDILLLGGASDRALCDLLAQGHAPDRVVNAAGETSLLASAALVGRAAVLISNDSAPVHMASAMGTPVVEIYGATVPGFGFTPFGVPHRIVELHGLSCRPCGIHGGDVCPVKTFACMRELAPSDIVRAARELLVGA